MMNPMAKTKKNTAKQPAEPDAVYFLKLVVYLILGSLWLKVTDGDSMQIPIPVGLFVGLLLASHDRLQLDRKIGIAVLLVAMLVGFWLPFGIYVAL